MAALLFATAPVRAFQFGQDLDENTLRGDLEWTEDRLRFEKDSDKRISLLFQKAALRFQLKMPKTAQKAYKQIIKLAKEDDSIGSIDALQAQLYIAETYSQQRMPNGAIDAYKELAEEAKKARAGQYRALAEERIREIDALARYKDELKKEEDKDNPLPGRVANLTFIVAELYEELNCAELAAEFHKKFYDGYSSHVRAPESGYRRARLLMSLSRYSEAEGAFKEIAEKYPASWFEAASLFQLGRIYLSQERWAESLDALKTLVEKRPAYVQYPEAVYLLAYCYENLGNRDENLDDRKKAAKRYEQFLKLVGGEEGLAGSLALSDIAFAAKADSWAALKSSTVQKIENLLAVRVVPASASGNRLDPYQRADGSRRDYETEIELYLRRADECEEAGKAGEAARIRIRAAELYERRAEYSKAVIQYRLVADKNLAPWSNRALMRIAGILLQKEDAEAALEEMTRLMERGPNSAEEGEAYVLLGKIYLKLGRDSEALDAFRSAIEAPPQPTFLPGGFEESPADIAAYSIARLNARLLSEEGKHQEAIEEFTDFKKKNALSPRMAATDWEISLLYEDMGDEERAVEAAKSALSRVEARAAQRVWFRIEFPSEFENFSKDYLEKQISARIGRLELEEEAASLELKDAGDKLLMEEVVSPMP